MVIYNITYAVPRNIASRWLTWMQEVHIPEIMEHGCYIKFQVVKLLDIQDEDAETYAVQFYAQTKEQHLDFIAYHQTNYKIKVSRQWGEEVVSFGTLMQIV